jgi:redox-sensitive bicupin YhaK (pirin superfamily)
MSTETVALQAPENPQPLRAIVRRTQGDRHGPITRLMSPGDLGRMVKPFVFLDLFEMGNVKGRGFAPHPHSGIATLTTFLEGSMSYGDTTGKTGSLSAGSVEWMRAGAGVWHAGHPTQGQAMGGYQLWLALPPELELAPPESLYLGSDRIQSAGPVRVLLGTYENMTSPIHLQMPLTYLHVRLIDGQRWTYQPAAGHDVAWLALNSGKIRASGTVLERELAVFAESNSAIELVAEGAVEFVIGSATKHPYPLITGHYSVHTSQAALTKGEQNIDELGRSPAAAALQTAH